MYYMFIEIVGLCYIVQCRYYLFNQYNDTDTDTDTENSLFRHN